MDRQKPQLLALVDFLSVSPTVSLSFNEISTLLTLEEKQVEWQTPALVETWELSGYGSF